MPVHHGVRFDNDQSLLPVAPETGQQNLKERVSWKNLRPFTGVFQDGQMLASEGRGSPGRDRRCFGSGNKWSRIVFVASS